MGGARQPSPGLGPACTTLASFRSPARQPLTGGSTVLDSLPTQTGGPGVDAGVGGGETWHPIHLGERQTDSGRQMRQTGREDREMGERLGKRYKERDGGKRDKERQGETEIQGETGRERGFQG